MTAKSSALTHVAMSVPVGTLTDDFRDDVLGFYGEILGWREIDQLRLPDRMTISVGKDCYLNVREREDAATFRGYDHVGVLVGSEDEARRLWDDLDQHHPEVTLRPISQVGGSLTYRFQHLLPMAIEVQFFG